MLVHIKTTAAQVLPRTPPALYEPIMSNAANMSVAELERTGLLYAIPILPPEIRTGLIVFSRFRVD